MVQVYNLIENEDKIPNSIHEIITSGIKFGPVPISKYPNTKGKNSWKLIGKNENFTSNLPFFKDHIGNLSVKDWSKLSPWRKIHFLSNDLDRTEYDYDQVGTLKL